MLIQHSKDERTDQLVKGKIQMLMEVMGLPLQLKEDLKKRAKE